MHFKPEYTHLRVFNNAEESELVDYLLLAYKHHHGLTTTPSSELAYQYALFKPKEASGVLEWQEKGWRRLTAVLYKDKYSYINLDARSNQFKSSNKYY